MPSVTALRRWLVFVALLRLFSGGTGTTEAWVERVQRVLRHLGRAAGPAQQPLLPDAASQPVAPACPPACVQWCWAMRRPIASNPTCTTSSQKEVSMQVPGQRRGPMQPAGRSVPARLPPTCLYSLVGCDR